MEIRSAHIWNDVAIVAGFSEPFLVMGLVSLNLAWLLGRHTAWSRRRVMWISPLPILALIAVLELWIAWMSIQGGDCQATDCKTTMEISSSISIAAAIAFVTSFGFARAGYWLAKR